MGKKKDKDDAPPAKSERGRKGKKGKEHEPPEPPAPPPAAAPGPNRAARRAAALAAKALAEAAEAQSASAAPADAGPEPDGDGDPAGAGAAAAQESEGGARGYDMLDDGLWCEVLHHLDGRNLASATCACAEFAAAAESYHLWTELQNELLSDKTVAYWERAYSERASGHSGRSRVCLSEATLLGWRQLGRGAMPEPGAATPSAPRPLPLPGMTCLALLGEVGVSLHAGRLARLWDARTGRRLAAYEHKRELTALAAAGEYIVAGDEKGGLVLLRHCVAAVCVPAVQQPGNTLLCPRVRCSSIRRSSPPPSTSPPSRPPPARCARWRSSRRCVPAVRAAPRCW